MPVQPSDTMLGATDVDEALGNLDDIIDAAIGQPTTNAKEQAGDFTDILGKAGERVEQTPEEPIDLSIIDDRITSIETPPTLEESRAASADHDFELDDSEGYSPVSLPAALAAAISDQTTEFT